MPDVQEVFLMATQKVRPDTGALERQLNDQRSHSIKRKVGALALVACLIAAGLLIGLNTMGDGSGRTVGTSPSITPRGALDYREFAVGSVAARGADLGLGWHLSYPDRMPNGDGICLAIGTSTTCFHFRDENEMSPVECLPQEGGYFVAISRTEVDRVWVEIEDSPTIEARWMPLRAPDGEMRAWLAFLPRSGKGTVRIGDSFEQAIRWAPCR